MSLGNTKDQGNKGNNFPYQLRHLQLLASLVECCEASGLSLAQVIELLTGIKNNTQTTNSILGNLNQEYTQGLVLSTLGNIKTKTDNLDVALSTRLADSTFTSRINTLGQKPSALSTPVVLPSDQVVNVNVTPNPTATDSFGRQRVSEPLTLFDSSHRFSDNGLWATQTVSGSTATFNADQGLVDLTVNGLVGSAVRRETYKTFSYQPGKSLLVLNTFVMAPAQIGLRQSVGYYGEDNGFYVLLEDNTLSFVKRTMVSGVLSEIAVDQASWNGDRLDGSGPSGITLDITKAQIFWADFEWLGVGSVRLGFIIDGQYILCHTFQHANVITSTYITTACLPLRYEIENVGGASGLITLKQICSSVISEGGYELRGAQFSASIPILSPISFAVAGTYYPIIGLKLLASRLDAIAILTAISVLGLGNGKNYAWRVMQNASITGGAWVSAGATSSVEYNISGTSVSGGSVLASGYVNSSNQGSPVVNILKGSLFSSQLERDTFAGTPLEIVLEVAVSTTSGGEGVLASVDWEEITR